MNNKLTALILLTLTAILIVTLPYYGSGRLGQLLSDPKPTPVPIVPEARKKIEAVFVLDTTGSMSGLISTAKQKIWSIASSMASAQNAPEVRIGLVAFRDRGDTYVTQVTDLSTDLDSVYATLMEYQAQGGGDTPESVNAGLRAAVDEISWSQDNDTYQVVFLLGDAPPHMDYSEEQFPSIVKRAASRNIVVNTIRCGTSQATEHHWQQIAALAQGNYFTVDQAAQAIAIATPFDNDIATLSKELDGTRIAFGDASSLAKARAKEAATDKLHAAASADILARRATFNAKAGGAKNAFGEDDLVAAVASGAVELEALETDALPAPLRDLSIEERSEVILENKAKRDSLGAKIKALIQQRSDYISAQAPAVEDAESSLEYQLFDTVKEQAAKVGLSYDTDTPEL